MRWLVLAVVLVVGQGAARADDHKPWAAGVSAKHQQDALALYNKGNTAFEQAEYKDALAIYVEALALWDHPAIRYNAAVCRINLDRTLEAYDDLELALRFGAAPLGPDLYKQGLNYQKLLAKQVAELEIIVDDPAGATVSLDGKPLFTSPGVKQQRVLAGDHQIVVEKPRYQTETRPVKIGGGGSEHVRIAIRPLAGTRTLHRRWSAWVPWTVMIAGGAVAAAGAPFILASKHNYDLYDAGVTASCTKGCPPTPVPQSVADHQSAAKLDNTVAVSLFAVGGAAIAAGFAMVILNQPRLGPVTPVVGSDHAGLVLTGSW